MYVGRKCLVSPLDGLEEVAGALFFFMELTNQPSLPKEVSAKFGFNLADFLIELVLTYDDAEEKGNVRGAQVHSRALKSLLCMNLHFSSCALDENRVLNKLLYSEQDVQRLGQIFIRIINRADDPVAMPAMTKLMHDIFCNEVASKSFFFTNDLQVLVEILLRNVINVSDQSIRRMLLDILRDCLTKSEYPTLLHRKEDVVDVLKRVSAEEGIS